MSAVCHEVNVIQLLQLVRLCEKRLNYRAIRIVNHQHDVRQLNRSTFPHCKTGRNALLYSLFCRTDGRDRTQMIIIILQIKCHYQPLTVTGSASVAGGQDNTGRQLFQNTASQILIHCIMDCMNPCINIRLLEIRLRQGDPQGRGRAAYLLVELFPVFRLGCVLVTGNDCPFGKIGASFGHQNAGNPGGVFRHNAFLLPEFTLHSMDVEQFLLLL